MIFTETKLKGAFIIDLEKQEDDRGFFARSWCRQEFEAHGISACIVQCNVSFNKRKGTLRGMHYQVDPYPEAKVVRCTRGAIYDVIIDLRSYSHNFRQWIAVELTANNHKMLYVPEGFAHGFQTLEDDSEVFYLMSQYYSPDCARGVRWDDPAIAISWPIANPIMSVQDRSYKYLDSEENT